LITGMVAVPAGSVHRPSMKSFLYIFMMHHPVFKQLYS
jgi:hypothetical protein